MKNLIYLVLALVLIVIAIVIMKNTDIVISLLMNIMDNFVKSLIK